MSDPYPWLIVRLKYSLKKSKFTWFRENVKLLNRQYVNVLLKVTLWKEKSHITIFFVHRSLCAHYRIIDDWFCLVIKNRSKQNKGFVVIKYTNTIADQFYNNNKFIINPRLTYFNKLFLSELNILWKFFCRFKLRNLAVLQKVWNIIIVQDYSL